METDNRRRLSRRRKMECSYLCLELVEQILSYLPLKARTRMRCVSKSWFSLITPLDLESIASTGFVVSHPGNQAIVLARSSESGECIGPTLFDITLQLPESAVLVDSCNGLLLYAVVNERYYEEFYVVSPMCKQFVRIPHGCHGKIRDTAFVGLAFDGGTGQNSHFKVICYVPKPQVVPHETWIDCQIFNSGDGEWRSSREKIFYSRVESTCSRKFFGRTYHDGKLFCLWNEWMLIYNVEKNMFQGVQTPSVCAASGNNPYCLWLSGGHLHCFVNHIVSFELFVYVDDDRAGGEGKWVMEHMKPADVRRQIRSEIQQLVTQQELKKIEQYFRLAIPVAFNSELKMLYLWAGFVLISYCFETSRTKIAWWPDRGAALSDKWVEAAVQPLRLNSVDLSHMRGSCQY